MINYWQCSGYKVGWLKRVLEFDTCPGDKDWVTPIFGEI